MSLKIVGFSIWSENYTGPVKVAFDNVSITPEPASFILFGLGSVLLGGIGHFKKKK